MPKRKMSEKDMKAWTEKTLRLNKDHEISRGDSVQDRNGWKGVVVRIEHGSTIESHGTIYVWQSERMEYGADNCEHYAYVNWRKCLRVIEPASTEPDSYWED